MKISPGCRGLFMVEKPNKKVLPEYNWIIEIFWVGFSA
jgi:hypothetical protein